jgi:hypothetical protein
MANSCSSDQLNSCAGCGPSLSLWKISSQESLNKTEHGYGCLNNSQQKRYLNNNLNLMQQRTSDSDCQKDNGNNTNGSLNLRYQFYVSEEYGDILPYQTSTLNYTDNISQVDPCIAYQGILQISNNTQTKARFICNNGNPYMQNYSEENCSYTDVWGYNGETSYSNITNDCFSNMYYPTAQEATSCTQSQREESTTNRCCGPWESCNIRCTESLTLIQTLSEEITLSKLFLICDQATSIKIDNYKTNLPYSCNGTKCGTGKKDDCWDGAGSFSIADNNLDDPTAVSTTSQKIKFKIAALKEDFDKKYQRVSGKVYFYYGGTGGKTPCCNDDFDGTVVEETGYSISASSSTFKDDYFAKDCGGFDNNDQTLVGQTINICYTVDNISFF